MLQRISLRTKLLVGFIFVSVVTMAVGLFGINRMHVIDDNSSVLYQKVTVPLSYISDIAVSFQRIRVNMAVLVGATDKDELKEMVEGNKKLRENILKKLELLDKIDQPAEMRKLLADIVESRDAYAKLAEKVTELTLAGQLEAADKLLQGETRQKANVYRAAVDKFIEAKNTQGQELATANKNNTQSSSTLMYLFMGAAVAASVGLGLILTSNVSAQLGEDPGYLYEVANTIASGDLDVTFRAQKKEGGVYAVMQGMVKTMKVKIAEAEQKTSEASQEAQRAKIATDEANEAKAQAERAKADGMLAAANQIEGVVEVVTSASEELSAQIEESSRGAEEQARRVGETATAMEEMNATVLEVAKSASQAAETADKAKLNAEDGALVVQQLVSFIDQVLANSKQSLDDMGALGKQAEGIGNILNVISDIADQTNLLALNAAIEAARAGEAGRGFAVVADEVRKLAEKTMSATREVGEAINGIQQGTRMNYNHVEQAVTAITEATQLAEKSGESLGKIVKFVENTSDQVRSIATASEQQSSASEEINRSIEDVNRISSEMSDAMQQSAQAVSEMANQAQVLKNLVENMKNEGGGGRSQALPTGRRALS